MTPTTVINPNFNYEEDKEGVNMICKITKENKKDLQMISVDLMLKKIAIENFSSEDPLLMNYFIMQFHAFINVDILLQKIINLYGYFQNENNIGESITGIYPVGIVKFLNN